MLFHVENERPVKTFGQFEDLVLVSFIADRDVEGRDILPAAFAAPGLDLAGLDLYAVGLQGVVTLRVIWRRPMVRFMKYVASRTMRTSTVEITARS